MKTKRILALLIAVLMLAGCLAACGESTGNDETTPAGSNNAGAVTEYESWSSDFIAAWGDTVKSEAEEGKITLKVWGPELAQDVLKDETARFAELFKDYADITFEIAIQGEGDAAAQVINDPKVAADVFGFPSDQIYRLKNADALAKAIFSKEAAAENTADSVAAATIDDTLYAYPEIGDNSYFLTYDKRVVTDEQAKSLESILEACKTAGKKFIMNAGDGYFACMFLFTGGLATDGFKEDGLTQNFNDYDIEKVYDSVSAFGNLFQSYKGTFETADTTAVADGFKSDPTTVGAGFVGSWNVAAVKEALGDNAGFAILPTIEINGEATQIINMFGYKFLGVNSQSKYPFTSQLLAYYLGNEENQIERAEKLEWGPSNINAQNSDYVKNNASMAAILAQSEFSVPQTAIANTFWNPVGTLGKYIVEPGNDISDAAIKTQVDACIVSILDE